MFVCAPFIYVYIYKLSFKAEQTEVKISISPFISSFFFFLLISNCPEFLLSLQFPHLCCVCVSSVVKQSRVTRQFYRWSPSPVLFGLGQFMLFYFANSSRIQLNNIEVEVKHDSKHTPIGTGSWGWAILCVFLFHRFPSVANWARTKWQLTLLSWLLSDCLVIKSNGNSWLMFKIYTKICG